MDDKIYALSKRIRNMEEEIIEVKKELRNLKTQNGANAEVVDNVPRVKPKVKPKHNVERKTEPMSLEEMVGIWLPRVFIFVLILGIIWAFVAAAQQGWFGPVLRVMIGFAVSGFLYWIGTKQFNQTKNALSIALLGGSIVVYVVSIFAGNVLYQFIPYIVTLFLLGLGIYAGVWMSRKYNSQSLLAIIGVGAYFYPFLFAGDMGNEYIFYIYETLVFMGLILESLRKQYKVTWNIANYSFIFTVLIFTAIGVGDVSLITLLTLGVQQGFIIYLTFKVNNLTSKEMYIPAISTGAFFMFTIGNEIFENGEIGSYIFYLLMSASYYVLSVLKNSEHKELKNIFFVFSMFYLFLFISEILADKEIVFAVLTLQSIVVYYVSQKRNSLLGTIGSLFLLLPVIVQLFDNPGYMFTISSVICWILIIGFFFALYLNKIQSVVIKNSFIKKASPYTISLLIVVLFGKISSLLTHTSNYMYSDIGLSVSWMLFVGVMYASYSYFKDKHWNYIGLTFLIITLAKITLYDLANVDIVWRAILFIVLGIVGLFISRIFYNKKEK